MQLELLEELKTEFSPSTLWVWSLQDWLSPILKSTNPLSFRLCCFWNKNENSIFINSLVHVCIDRSLQLKTVPHLWNWLVFYFSLFCMWTICLQGCICIMYVLSSWRPEKDIRAAVARVPGGSELQLGTENKCRVFCKSSKWSQAWMLRLVIFWMSGWMHKKGYDAYRPWMFWLYCGVMNSLRNYFYVAGQNCTC